MMAIKEYDVAALERKIKSAGMHSGLQEYALQELLKLKGMQLEPVISRSWYTYLEHLANLPWQKFSVERKFNHKDAMWLFDAEFCGLVGIKERIIEYLAERKLKRDDKILCFVGPSGTGKTSIISLTARLLNREFFRIPLGGVNNEAVIKGSRQANKGGMPGLLIQGLARVAVGNPVMLLDKIDQMGSDGPGDPASALLEVLDPVKSKAFYDCYLDIKYDLSNVMFVASANDSQFIPIQLQNRMRVIKFHAYDINEKLQIAIKHLIPRLLDTYNLTGPKP